MYIHLLFLKTLGKIASFLLLLHLTENRSFVTHFSSAWNILPLSSVCPSGEAASVSLSSPLPLTLHNPVNKLYTQEKKFFLSSCYMKIGRYPFCSHHVCPARFLAQNKYQIVFRDSLNNFILRSSILSFLCRHTDMILQLPLTRTCCLIAKTLTVPKPLVLHSLSLTTWQRHTPVGEMHSHVWVMLTEATRHFHYSISPPPPCL